MTDTASTAPPSKSRDVVRAALAALGIENLVLAIHDASFPSFADEDTGRGSPYTRGAAAFFDFVSELGFDGVQLGPQGETSPSNPSPYDGSVFSKGLVSIALADLAGPSFAGLLRASDVVEAVEAAARAGANLGHRTAFALHHALVRRASDRLQRRVEEGDADARELAARVDHFARDRAWLRHDAVFQALVATHGTDDWHAWPAVDRDLLAPSHADDAAARARLSAIEADHRATLDAWAFGQFVLAEQHRALRIRAGHLGLALYGDLQIGLSLRDTWSRADLFLAGHRLGAPPSRTNPDGQPWGYPIFDPRKYMRRFSDVRASTDDPYASTGDFARSPGAFFAARVDKLFSDFDGVRIDHPHGLVCPWVYRATNGEGEVQRGARLFESPDDPAHPELSPFAIARPDQIDHAVPPYADRRVRDLDPAQVEEYAFFFDLLDDARRRHGRGASALLCEVLSTCPEPLRAVMRRADIGRFRVTQKASMRDPADGYRSEHAEPHDWIMVGNHDTPPLLAVVDRWMENGAAAERAAYLAERLSPDAADRPRMASSMASSPRLLLQGMFAELFSSRARHVMVFFADLFGTKDVYNTPGIVRDDNWRLRVPADFRSAYAASLARGDAFDLPASLALAMRARGGAFVAAHASLIAELEALSAPSDTAAASAS